MAKKIESIQVINAEKRRIPSKHYVYVIIVTWSDGSRVTIYRRYSRFFDLQTRLLDHFPIEAGTIDPERRLIPFLPGKIFFGRSQIKDVAMKRLKEIDEYCKSLIKLPPHISECDDVLEFFEVEPDDLDPPTDSHDKSKTKSSQETKAEKISSPKRFECYVAVAEYSVQAAGELSLKPGLKVEVLEKSDSGWWFVNSQDEKGWVPSTYLEREGGSDPLEKQGQIADPGQEENYICIEKFDAASADEVSLDKGSVVQVLQKNLDGWWLIRYKGKEAYAPGTYLKKATNMHIVSVVEKSRLSGVQIIGSLHDVSNLLNQGTKTGSEPVKPATQPQNRDAARVSSNAAKHSGALAVIKQRSLERGGSLNPPPRHSSIRKMDIPLSVNMATLYVTADDFTDTVGDGLSFKKGEKVEVSEKTSTGWWLVKIGQNEGWVPAAYLEPCSESNVDDTNYYEDDEDWYVEPEDVEDIVSASDNPVKRPLPAVPPDETQVAESPARLAVSNLADKLPMVAPKKATSSYKLDAVTKPPELRISSSEPSVIEAVTGGPKSIGSQDLASMLKAKFEARAKSPGISDRTSDEDTPKSTKSGISDLQKIHNSSVPNTKSTPVVPSKPFDPQGSHKSSNFGDTKFTSKPPPPAKMKPLKPDAPTKPSIVPPGIQASKPAKLPLPSKPLSKPSLGNEDKSPERMHIKSPTVGLGKPDNFKFEPGKPIIKPQISNKPKTTMSSNVITTGKSASTDHQSVNNIAKNLSGKLNFGQPSIKSPSEGMKSYSGVSGGAPKPSTAFTPAKSRSHIAAFSFVAENDGELGFSEGDEIEVLEQQGDWSLVRILGKEGWAPSGYLQKL
ncbi:hypothetical protein BsWGS_04545 [Bradybaena similaris]